MLDNRSFHAFKILPPSRCRGLSKEQLMRLPVKNETMHTVEARDEDIFQVEAEGAMSDGLHPPQALLLLAVSTDRRERMVLECPEPTADRERTAMNAEKPLVLEDIQFARHLDAQDRRVTWVVMDGPLVSRKRRTWAQLHGMDESGSDSDSGSDAEPEMMSVDRAGSSHRPSAAAAAAAAPWSANAAAAAAPTRPLLDGPAWVKVSFRGCSATLTPMRMGPTGRAWTWTRS